MLALLQVAGQLKGLQLPTESLSHKETRNEKKAQEGKQKKTKSLKSQDQNWHTFAHMVGQNKFYGRT